MRPHELFLSLLLATLAIRLPWPESGMIGALLLFHLYFSLRKETPIKLWCKRLAQVAYVPLLYFSFKRLIPLLGSTNQDAFFQRVDTFFIRESLSVKMRALAHPFLTEAMYLCYMLFFAYVILSLWRHRHKESFYVGLFTIYWIGFLGYTCCPAEGPYLAIRELAENPLREGLYASGPIYDFLLASNNRADVFPSLHCAISAFCLCFDWKHKRGRFWYFFPLVIGIWVATVYLGYHYLVDIAVGSILTIFALFLERKFREHPNNFPVSG